MQFSAQLCKPVQSNACQAELKFSNPLVPYKSCKAFVVYGMWNYVLVMGALMLIFIDFANAPLTPTWAAFMGAGLSMGLATTFVLLCS